MSIQSSITITLLLLLFAACSTTKKTVVNVDPYITFDTKTYDFGEVRVGENPEYTYHFTNTGTEPVTIELISGCDCTEFVDPPHGKTYLPGEKGNFKIIFKSLDEPDRGQMEKTIDILLENIDPKTQYQIVKEVFYTLNLRE